MDVMQEQALPVPRFEEREAIQVAGIGRTFTFGQLDGVPALWSRFGRIFGAVPGQVGPTAYGVMYVPFEEDADFGYMAAVEVADLAQVPADLQTIMIPAHRYAVVSHEGHVSTLGDTIRVLRERWLPQSGHSAPCLEPGSVIAFERYAEDFDPVSGRGGMEVWQPIER